MTEPINWRKQLAEIGGYDNELVGVPAGAALLNNNELFLAREDATAMAEWLATCRKGGAA